MADPFGEFSNVIREPGVHVCHSASRRAVAVQTSAPDAIWYQGALLLNLVSDPECVERSSDMGNERRDRRDHDGVHKIRREETLSPSLKYGGGVRL